MKPSTSSPQFVFSTTRHKFDFRGADRFVALIDADSDAERRRLAEHPVLKSALHAAVVSDRLHKKQIAATIKRATKRAKDLLELGRL
jgi:hypothetical protein